MTHMYKNMKIIRNSILKRESLVTFEIKNYIYEWGSKSWDGDLKIWRKFIQTERCWSEGVDEWNHCTVIR